MAVRIVMALVLYGLASFNLAFAQTLVCEREMTRVARASGIPLNILFSVGLTETGSHGQLNPFDLNVDGRAIHLTSLQEAMARVAAERAAGAKLIDIGCMQINLKWHGAQFHSVAEMFDPTRNVTYAARFLLELKARYGTWTLAVARYNAGPDNNLAQKKYVCSVIGNMVRSGLGAWTPAARAFCDRPAVVKATSFLPAPIFQQKTEIQKRSIRM